jgi:hypothetical protein
MLEAYSTFRLPTPHPRLPQAKRRPMQRTFDFEWSLIERIDESIAGVPRVRDEIARHVWCSLARLYQHETRLAAKEGRPSRGCYASAAYIADDVRQRMKSRGSLVDQVERVLAWLKSEGLIFVRKVGRQEGRGIECQRFIDFAACQASFDARRESGVGSRQSDGSRCAAESPAIIHARQLPIERHRPAGPSDHLRTDAEMVEPGPFPHGGATISACAPGPFPHGGATISALVRNTYKEELQESSKDPQQSTRESGVGSRESARGMCFQHVREGDHDHDRLAWESVVRLLDGRGVAIANRLADELAAAGFAPAFIETATLRSRNDEGKLVAQLRDLRLHQQQRWQEKRASRLQAAQPTPIPPTADCPPPTPASAALIERLRETNPTMYRRWKSDPTSPLAVAAIAALLPSGDSRDD